MRRKEEAKINECKKGGKRRSRKKDGWFM